MESVRGSIEKLLASENLNAGLDLRSVFKRSPWLAKKSIKDIWNKAEKMEENLADAIEFLGAKSMVGLAMSIIRGPAPEAATSFPVSAGPHSDRLEIIALVKEQLTLCLNTLNSLGVSDLASRYIALGEQDTDYREKHKLHEELRETHLKSRRIHDACKKAALTSLGGYSKSYFTSSPGSSEAASSGDQGDRGQRDSDADTLNVSTYAPSRV